MYWICDLKIPTQIPRLNFITIYTFMSKCVEKINTMMCIDVTDKDYFEKMRIRITAFVDIDTFFRYQL